MTDEQPGRDIGVDALRVTPETPSPPTGSNRSGGLLALLAVVAGIGALVLAFAGPGAERVVDEPDPTVAPLPSVIPIETAEPVGTPNEVEQELLDAHSDRIGQAIAQIDSDGRNYGIAYVSSAGLMVMNHSGVAAPDLDVAQNFGLVLGLPLFAADRQTWAIDPRDAGSAHLVTSSFVVVQSAKPNVLAVYDEGRQEIELLASGQPAPGIELPEGARVLAVQGRGLLVLPRTGGTFEVDGLAASLRRIDDGVAVAASRGATLLQRCDEQLQCEVVLRTSGEADDEGERDSEGERESEGERDSEKALALDLGATLSVSPLGRWVVEYGDGGAGGDGGDGDSRLVDTASDSFVTLGTSEILATSWASDERFVALLRDRKIELYFPAENRSVWLDLVVPPVVDAIIVYSSAVLDP